MPARPLGLLHDLDIGQGVSPDQAAEIAFSICHGMGFRGGDLFAAAHQNIVFHLILLMKKTKSHYDVQNLLECDINLIEEFISLHFRMVAIFLVKYVQHVQDNFEICFSEF